MKGLFDPFEDAGTRGLWLVVGTGEDTMGTAHTLTAFKGGGRGGWGGGEGGGGGGGRTGVTRGLLFWDLLVMDDGGVMDAGEGRAGEPLQLAMLLFGSSHKLPLFVEGPCVRPAHP
ncbi:hypothetical protein L7F22_046124 [Adiantum nelumboides]|nr:hypothetical protein [Adiantum nelumboides]